MLRRTMVAATGTSGCRRRRAESSGRRPLPRCRDQLLARAPRRTGGAATARATLTAQVPTAAISRTPTVTGGRRGSRSRRSTGSCTRYSENEIRPAHCRNRPLNRSVGRGAAEHDEAGERAAEGDQRRGVRSTQVAVGHVQAAEDPLGEHERDRATSDQDGPDDARGAGRALDALRRAAACRPRPIAIATPTRKIGQPLRPSASRCTWPSATTRASDIGSVNAQARRHPAHRRGRRSAGAARRRPRSCSDHRTLLIILVPSIRTRSWKKPDPGHVDVVPGVPGTSPRRAGSAGTRPRARRRAPAPTATGG